MPSLTEHTLAGCGASQQRRWSTSAGDSTSGAPSQPRSTNANASSAVSDRLTLRGSTLRGWIIWRLIIRLAPRFGVIASCDVLMKARMRPFVGRRHQPVLHRVEVDVVHVTAKVVVIAYSMFPKSSLPDSALAPRHTAFASELAIWQQNAEIRLDPSPARRVVGVVGWQCPHPVHVIWQHHPPGNYKRSPSTFRSDATTKQADVSHQHRIAPTIMQINGEEPCRPVLAQTAIVGHGIDPVMALTDHAPDFDRKLRRFQVRL